MSGISPRGAALAGAGLLLAGAASFMGGWAFLSLGFVIGMAHALEADHLAAVAAMTDRRDGRRALIARGAFWGLGHTLALFAICTTVVLLGLSISGRAEAALELVVGLMIAALGLRVLWRMHRERIHIHVHEHDGHRHLHAHTHSGERPHAQDHGHRHRVGRGELATMGVGLVHGAAGSAGLLVLTVAATESIGQSLAYFAIFGVGSMVGMAALSAVLSLPLSQVQRGAGWMKSAVSLAIAGLALFIGGGLALESLPGLQAAPL